MTPILGVTYPRKGATKNLTGIVLVCFVVAICVVFLGGLFLKISGPLCKAQMKRQSVSIFVATDAIGFRTHTFRRVAEITRWSATQRTAARKALLANTLQQ